MLYDPVRDPAARRRGRGGPGGARLLTDGPFAETTEQLGGFYLVDVPDLDTMTDLCSLLPHASRSRCGRWRCAGTGYWRWTPRCSSAHTLCSRTRAGSPTSDGTAVRAALASG